ncbi:hypothetical protein J6590_052718 [Homalodisca vitripennis]|nr:hypothetical protein J6590_052718 [Homalodisca vitripennis]
MGYSAYVALELPRKTKRQVRDRLVTLRGYRYPYGLLDAPEPPAPIQHHLAWPRLPRVDHLQPDWTSPRWDMTPPGHLDWTSPRMDMTSLGIPNETLLRQLICETEHLDLTTSRWDMTPPGHLDKTTLPDVTSPQWDMTPLGSPMAKTPWAITGLGLTRVSGRGLWPTESVNASRAGRGDESGLEAPAEPPEGEHEPRPPGDSPPASPPGVAPDPGPRQEHWRSERTRRKVTRYASTQDSYKKNPSCLVEVVLKNELGDLLADGPRVMPPQRETLELYRGMWGAPVDSTLSLRGFDLQEDELVRIDLQHQEGR